MTQVEKFRARIVCEDIRDELGNKKSLMGVISGDVIVPQFPATIPVAMFFEFVADEVDGDAVSIVVRILHDDVEVGQLKLVTAGRNRLGSEHVMNFVVPRGYMTFEKAATFSVRASVNGAPEEEIIRKKIFSNVSASAFAPPSSQSQPAAPESST